MNQQSSCAPFRELLRAFALKTLSEAEHMATQRHLDACPDCAAALEEEIRALSALDQLPDAEPSLDLAGAIMEQVRQQPAPRRKRSRRRVLLGYAAAGCVILMLAGVLLPALNRARESARMASSAGTLKQFGVIFKVYANESKGEVFPAITPYDGLWTFDVESLASEVITDLTVLLNPRSKENTINGRTIEELQAEDTVDWEAMTQLASRNYTYIGWSVEDEDDLALVVEAMAGDDPTPRGEREVAREGESVQRLREGVERFMITDINNPAASAKGQSEIPVMFETMNPDNPKKFYNVLYMDGHVEAVRYGEKFPITERVARMLANAP